MLLCVNRKRLITTVWARAVSAAGLFRAGSLLPGLRGTFTSRYIDTAALRPFPPSLYPVISFLRTSLIYKFTSHLVNPPRRAWIKSTNRICVGTRRSMKVQAE